MDIRDAGFTPAVAVGIAVANCLEPLLSASLLRRWIGRAPDLSRLAELGRFYAAACVCGPALGAVVGSIWPWLVNGSDIWPQLGRWFIGDSLGVVIIAPVILVSARGRPAVRPSLEQVATFVGLLVIAAVSIPWSFGARIGLPFLVIPALAFVGVRLGTRAAAFCVLLVGLLVEWETARGAGPFSGDDAFTGLLAAQMYLVACSVSALTPAALMTGLVSRDHMAFHDSLTGLANRRLLGDRVAVACGQLARHPGRVGLVFIDLDDFKTINDVHGHTVGDRVLTETARRLRASVRDEDTIARLGGDEFVVLVTQVDDDEHLPRLCDRVHEALAAPISAAAVPLRVEASLGFSTTDRHDEGLEALVARADGSMYAHKRERAAAIAG
jgi:diguanylate cyclase (GGDEF)-like protein